MRVKKSNVLATAMRLGVSVEINHPGDGKTRYTLTVRHWSITLRGPREAEIFLMGYEIAQEKK